MGLLFFGSLKTTFKMRSIIGAALAIANFGSSPQSNLVYNIADSSMHIERMKKRYILRFNFMTHV
jgi:hypothetical protein